MRYRIEMKKSHKIILSVAAFCLLGLCVWLGCRAFMRPAAAERRVPPSHVQARDAYAHFCCLREEPRTHGGDRYSLRDVRGRRPTI